MPEVYANNASTVVVSGGATAPSSGTVESWTVASPGAFPALSAGQTFHVADPASAATATEKIKVTATSGSTWTVTRGDESTTPVVHAAGFTVVQVVTAGGYAGFLQGQLDAFDAAGAAATAQSNAESFATSAVATETTRAETAEALALQKAGNLSDVASVSAARTNLGLGSAATQATSAFDTSGAAATAQATAETFATAAVATETTRAEAAEALKLAIAQNLADLASRQTALDTLAGATTAGQFLRGNGTHVALGAIQAGDVPTLNQSTTGNAATATNLAGGAVVPAYLAPAVTALTFVGSGTTLVNAALGNSFNLTLTASTTTLGSPSNPEDGQVIRFRITQGTGGGFTLAYGSAYDFGAGTAPTLSTAAGKVDILGFEYVASISMWCYLGSGLGF